MKIEPIAREALEHLKQQGLSLATAESCTGGLVGKLLTDVPGASAFYRGGVISYTNEVKQHVLGVSEDTLRTYTAVSRQTAHEMARGVRQLLKADAGISVTGLAGPDSDETGRPVGLVYVAIDAAGFSFCQELHLPGDRSMVRALAAEAALQLVIDYL